MVGVNVNIWQIIYLKFMIFWQKSYLDTRKRVGPNRSWIRPCEQGLFETCSADGESI